MPAQPAAAGGQPAAQGGQQNNGQSIMRTVLQSAAIFMGIQFVMQRLLPAKTTTTATDAEGNTIKVPANTGNIPPFLLRPANLDEGATWNPIPQRIAPIWPADSKLDIVISVSPSFIPTSLRKTNPTNIVLQEKAFGLNNYSDTRSVDTTINIPVDVQNNGTLWGHFYIGLTGHPIDPVDHGFDPANAYHFVFPLTQHIAKKKEAKVRNLLEAQDVEEEVVEEDTTTGPIIGNYYHPNTSLSFIPGSGVLDYPQTHPAVRQFLQLEATGARDGSGQNAWYYPILFINTFWQLKSHMTLLNDTVKTVPLHIDLGNLADWKFKTMAAIELSGREAARTAAFGGSLPGGGDGSEIQMIKEILLDTNPILLTITTLVAIAHMILETLAFGSDIAHYRKKKDNVGISVRSILANVFMQSVIFLYLIDNSQTTSWMILGSQGIGILIEFWKITTVVNVRVRDSAPGSFFPKRIVFEDKHKLSETEEKTKEYDEIAFKYMYWAGVPLLIAYAAYSLYYDSHKSWYSFIITTLVGSVYAYGFLMMVPSLYINYRLKSVAHMPGKAMMYKFLNTFIDDLFAFTIKMPFLHRLACFRDDIIFFIYLYQRWAYRIDYTRVNEFGQGGDDETEEQKSAEGKALPPAVPVEPEEEKKTTKKEEEELQAKAKATGASKGAAKKRK